jgi:hypothetical protein
VPRIGRCWIKRNFEKNAFQVELPEAFDISLIFDVSDLYMYEAVEDNAVKYAKID